MHIAIQRVLRAFLAGGHVDVRPSIVIEIDDRHGRTHRRDLRHDVLQPRVERGRLVHEIDAGGARYLLQIKTVTRQRSV